MTSSNPLPGGRRRPEVPEWAERMPRKAPHPVLQGLGVVVAVLVLAAMVLGLLWVIGFLWGALGTVF